MRWDHRTSKSSECGESLRHQPSIAWDLTWQLSYSELGCVPEHDPLRTHPWFPADIFNSGLKGDCLCLFLMSFLSDDLKNKGYLINTADPQGLKCLKLLREEKQLCVRVCKLTRGRRIEGSPHSRRFHRNASFAAATLGPGTAIPASALTFTLVGGPETQNGV